MVGAPVAKRSNILGYPDETGNLPGVTDLTFRRSLRGRLLSYGTLIVESAGPIQALNRIDYIPRPEEVYEALSELVFDEKGRTRPLDRMGARRLARKLARSPAHSVAVPHLREAPVLVEVRAGPGCPRSIGSGLRDQRRGRRDSDAASVAEDRGHREMLDSHNLQDAPM